jgi:hypothetical protein
MISGQTRYVLPYTKKSSAAWGKTSDHCRSNDQGFAQRHSGRFRRQGGNRRPAIQAVLTARAGGTIYEQFDQKLSHRWRGILSEFQGYRLHTDTVRPFAQDLISFLRIRSWTLFLNYLNADYQVERGEAVFRNIFGAEKESLSKPRKPPRGSGGDREEKAPR